MKLHDYIWFWRTSWSYMSGSRIEFWLGLPRATMGYRKAFIQDKADMLKYAKDIKDK